MCEPTTTSNKANRASNSLLLAFGEAAHTASGRDAMLSGVALNRAKAKTRLSSEAKAKAPCVLSEITLQAPSGDAGTTSNSETNALCAFGKAKASASEASRALLSSAKIALLAKLNHIAKLN